jgi:outer membrane lipoprotein-sorting protein
MLRRIFLGCISTALVGLSLATSAAPDGNAIMRKAVEAMSKAKTYQSDWRTIISMGSMGSMTMNMSMKTAPGGKVYMHTTPAGQGTGMMAAGAAMAESITVSDGKTVYMYMKAMNAYMKMPAPKNTNLAMSGQFGALNQKDATYKLIGTEFVRGRKCYVVAVTPKLPEGGAARGMKAEATAYVDQQTGRLRQIKTKMTMPGMPGGPGAPGQPGKQGNGQQNQPMVMTTTMVLLSEKLDAPIPASTFTFKPPAGAREMQGNMMGGPGMGAPGIGGPR